MNAFYKKRYDVIVIGAGAAGLMAAATAGSFGKKVLLLEASNKIGEKIRISGGGRCNFTNLYASPQNYLSNNPRFAISPLARFTQADFIKLVESYNIAYHEKTLGQLFCDGSSTQIIEMLVNECKNHQVDIELNCQVSSVSKNENFQIETNLGSFESTSLIIATGGLSIPKMGASDFGYRIAKQFDINLIPTKPALVPLTTIADELEFCKALSGVSIASVVSYKKPQFKENILFTHRGLSGPAILQISSYIEDMPNKVISMNLLPSLDLKALFRQEKNSKILITSFLKEHLPKRFVEEFCARNIEIKKLTDYKLSELDTLSDKLQNFQINIAGNEGYLKAEVTVGGVDTNELSSKTMESKKVSNLYFVGEVVDVTGWLGGYNFQWAWSSGYIAGRYAL